MIEEYAAKNNLDVKVDGYDGRRAGSLYRRAPNSLSGMRWPFVTGIRKFNLMFKTFQGVTEDSTSEIYLRPETAQGIFINFKNAAHHAQKATLWHWADW